MYLVNIFVGMMLNGIGRGEMTTPIRLLTRGDGDLAAVAGQYHTLTSSKPGVALFLDHHNGAAVILADL